FDFAPAREIEVKGKPLPLQVYPLSGLRAVRAVERPPLVGRQQDLAQLALLYDRARDARRPQLVTIVAPAGTGKTRLLEEFLARLDPAGGFQIATARCLPYGHTLAYWPLRGLLTGLLGAETDRERLTAAFTAGGYSQDDSSCLAGPVLATL